jgi:hypothetical protein
LNAKGKQKHMCIVTDAQGVKAPLASGTRPLYMLRRDQLRWEKKQHERKEAETKQIEQEAHHFLANPLLFASDLSRPVLRQVLVLKGMCASNEETKTPYGRFELIKRVQEADADSKQRVRLALDSRSSNDGNKIVATRDDSTLVRTMSTNVLLIVACFLDQTSLVRLACVGRFFRTRLTFGLTGTPSLALASTRMCAIYENASRAMLSLLLDRATDIEIMTIRLGTLSTKQISRLLYRLQDCLTLKRLHICTNNTCVLMPCVQIPSLRTLRVQNIGDFDTLNLVSSRTSHVYGWSFVFLDAFLHHGCGALESLEMEAVVCNLSHLVGALCKLKRLHRLKLQDVIAARGSFADVPTRTLSAAERHTLSHMLTNLHDIDVTATNGTIDAVTGVISSEGTPAASP